MHGVVNVYFIWYGNWGTEYTKASAIINDSAKTIGGSPYENINTTYGDTTGNVSGQIHYAGYALDSGSLGTSLSDSSIASIVSNALTSKQVPVDTNGLYMVLTAPGVKETSGFLTQYCGWTPMAPITAPTSSTPASATPPVPAWAVAPSRPPQPQRRSGRRRHDLRDVA